MNIFDRMKVSVRNPPYFRKIAELLKTTFPDYTLHSREIIIFGMGYAGIRDWEFVEQTIIPAFQFYSAGAERFDTDKSEILKELLGNESPDIRGYSAMLFNAIFTAENGERYSPIHHDPYLRALESIALDDRDILPRTWATMAIVSAMKRGAPGFKLTSLDTALQTLNEGINKTGIKINFEYCYKPYMSFLTNLKRT